MSNRSCQARAHHHLTVTVTDVELNDRQLVAVNHPQTPLAVVAGPGSGKTRVLTQRIVQLIATGVDPSKILALTFTNKAAEEMRQRLASAWGEDQARRCWVMTFHAFCVRFLRREHARVGLPARFHIVDTDDAEKVLRRLLTETSPGTQRLSDAKSEASRLRHEISYAKNRLRPLSLVDDVALAYQRRLSDMGAVDFDDLLLFTLKALNDEDCHRSWSERFSHVLVDEFQDTNRPQLDILSKVASHRRVTVVGDAKQSVYGFRGSAPDVFDTFAERFGPVETVVLNQNYRSRQPVLDVCQALLPDGDHPLWTAERDGSRPQLWGCGDDRDEARRIVAGIEAAIAAGTPPAEVAVLVRTHALTRVLEDELMKRAVTYRMVGGRRFYDRAEIRDVLAWMRWVVNPKDAVAFERAVSAPRRGIGDKTVETVIDFCRRSGAAFDGRWEQWPTIPGRAREALAAMFGWRDELLAGPMTAEVVVRAVLAYGVAEHWRSQPDGDSRLENLEQLVSAAAEFDAGEDQASVDAFLEHVALSSSVDESGVGVQVMTIHAAKGREFDHVYVPGLETGVLPHANARTSRERDEERRLLFVACSRARHQLVLSYAHRRLVFGKVQDRHPSTFLADVLDHVDVDDRSVGSTSSTSRRRLIADPWTTRSARRTTPNSWSPTSPSRRTVQSSPVRTTPTTSVAVNRSGDTPPTRYDWSVGDRVRHPQFGDGVIMGVRRRDLEVRFPDRVRLLAADIAPLEPLPVAE